MGKAGFSLPPQQVNKSFIGQGRFAPPRGPFAAAPERGRWQTMALSWPEVVIGGGTPNIQRNIIAERILGLPKD